MTSCWAAEENCCIHCKHGDIQQGFGPRTFILCACCQDRGSHVECEEKVTGTWSLIAAAVLEWPQLRMRRNAKQDKPINAIRLHAVTPCRAGLPVSPQALEAGNDWFCSQVRTYTTQFHGAPPFWELNTVPPSAGLQSSKFGSCSSHQSGQDAFSWRHCIQQRARQV